LVSPDEGLFESRNLLFSQIVNFEFFKTVDVSSSVPTFIKKSFCNAHDSQKFGLTLV
jgi:hypothetical protein